MSTCGVSYWGLETVCSPGPGPRLGPTLAAPVSQSSSIFRPPLPAPRSGRLLVRRSKNEEYPETFKCFKVIFWNVLIFSEICFVVLWQEGSNALLHSIQQSLFKSGFENFWTPLRNTATGQVMGRDGSWWEGGEGLEGGDFSFREGRLDISKTYYHKQDTWCQHNYLNVCPEIAPYHLTHLTRASAAQRWG